MTTTQRRTLAVGVGLLLALAAAAVIGPALSPYDYAQQNLDAIFAPPSLAHPLGTARLGEDVLIQCLRGLQKSLVLGLLAAVVTTVLSAVVGTLAGYLGGLADRVLMTVVDVLLVLPSILIVAVVSPTLRGQSWLVLVVPIAAFQWMLTARALRARARALRSSGFVVAAENMGASVPRVVVRHLLPQMLPLLAIDCTMNVATAILAEAGLSYFGFGVQPPDVSLGSLVAAGTGSALTFPWVFLAPVGFLVVTVIGVGLVGEGLRGEEGTT
ncbi:Oligopeptide transport system permease protein OppC (TC 3.A.1.5.1) [Alloactinosynnema sp. L-07]|uniref:ABC transporter permease n=1 Tax=Alloactinosynnema sp. L-07 TaxID=1653480 RepID=UPI00065EFB0D|nr:ABC transporter permease [Alloactinosynnema sp. L-07]CRK58211.1 Oligopeptide transport system permease protein OppC (TC 3.A.1.5.1) [Alloactinosynnema sp. L-07]